MTSDFLISHGFVTHDSDAPCEFCNNVKKEFMEARKSGELFKTMQNKKPILNDVIKIFSNEEILTRLHEIYPDTKEGKKAYLKVLKELRTLKPSSSQISIDVVKVVDGEETYVDVSGSKTSTKLSYSLEFLPWNKWLGMKIAQGSLLHYNYLDIVCHCLWEMTFMGFDQEDIAKTVKELADNAKEIKNSLNKKQK